MVGPDGGGTDPEGSDGGRLRGVSAAPGVVVLDGAGVQRRYHVDRVGPTVYVDGPEGATVLTELDRFPLPGTTLAAGSLVAPLPGTVVRVAVGPGDAVAVGDVLVAIEAMKMEHEIRAHSAGTVTEVHVTAGNQVDAGRLLVVVGEAGETGGDEEAGPA